MQKFFTTLFIVLGLAIVPFTSTSYSPPSIGELAPEVKLPDVNGKELKLSKLRGNIVLVSFWSTWCVSCNVIKNPEYRRLYNRYKDYTFDNADGFTIYSVAFDSDKSKWQRRIEEEQLDWKTHVIDQDSYYSSYWFIYNIRSIPSSFLLDETGRIIGANMSFSQLDNELNKRKRARKVKNVLVGQDKQNGNNGYVTPTPPTQPTSHPNTTVQKTVYKIQLGVFRNPNLGKFTKLKEFGELETERTSPTSKLHRVLLGAFTQSQSNSVLRKIQDKGYRDAYVTTRQITVPAGSQSGNEIVDVIDEPITRPDVPTSNPLPENENDLNSTYLEKIYKIQLGVFGRYAESKFSHLKTHGNIAVENLNNGLKKVLLGSFKTTAEANTELSKVKPKGFKDAFLVKREELMTITAANVRRYKPNWEQDMSATPEEDTTAYLALMKLEYPALQGSMVGEVAPEILLRTKDGAALPLTALKDKYRLVHFWGSWSGPSRQNHT
ncbi:MAG: redoxin domain-containing protein, partial [Chitinophagales bacterium]